MHDFMKEESVIDKDSVPYLRGSEFKTCRPYVEERSESVVKQIDQITKKLEEAKAVLGIIQPDKTGKIVLSLNECKNGCVLCPHIRWWVWQPHKDKRRLPPLRVNNPLQRIKRTGDFAENYEQVRDIIKGGLALHDYRKKLVNKNAFAKLKFPEVSW